MYDEDESSLIDSRGRASPPGEASSGELSGELFRFSFSLFSDPIHYRRGVL